MQTLIDQELGHQNIDAFKREGNPHRALMAYIENTDSEQWGRKDRSSSTKQQAKISTLVKYLLDEAVEHKAFLLLAFSRRGNLSSAQASKVIAHLERVAWVLRTPTVIKGMKYALNAATAGEYIDRMFEVVSSKGCASYPDRPSYEVVSSNSARRFEQAACGLKGVNINPAHKNALTHVWIHRRSLTEFQVRKATKLMEKIKAHGGI